MCSMLYETSFKTRFENHYYGTVDLAIIAQYMDEPK